MSNDWSNGPGSNDTPEPSPWQSPNTTDPGEPGGGWQGETSGGFTPLGPASITDVFNNFGTVMSRSLNSGVIWAFAALLAAQLLVMCGGGVAALAATIGLSGLNEISANPAALGGSVMVVIGGVVAVSVIPQLFITGLFNPMRIALLEGQQPHQGFGWALGKAAENVVDIFLVGVLYIVLIVPAVGLTVWVSEWALLLWLPVALLAAFFLSPVLWYVATGHGVFASITKAFSTVMNNLLLFVLFFVIAIVGSLAFTCVNGVLSFIPLLGTLAGMLLGFFVQYVGWVFYVSTVATVESHELGRPIV